MKKNGPKALPLESVRTQVASTNGTNASGNLKMGD